MEKLDRMKKYWIIMSFLSVVLSLLGFNAASAEYKLAESYLGLRKQALELKPSQLHVEGKTSVLAVLMDMGLEGGVVSVVAVADGTASMYISNGGGILGSGEHDSVKTSAHAFISEAGKHLPELKLVTSFPVPNPGNIIFYIVTPDGVYASSQRPGTDIEQSGDGLFKLYVGGQALITQIRLIDEQRKRP
jgi:hypothetical protein